MSRGTIRARACRTPRFLDRVDRVVALAHRGQTTLALLLLDLDGFKEINDTLRHAYGDMLPQQVGARLRGAAGFGYGGPTQRRWNGAHPRAGRQ